MYKITLINNGVEEIIHHPHSSAPSVISCDVEEAINTVDQLTASLDVRNKVQINLFKTMIKLTDLTDNKIAFFGRIIKHSQAMGSNGNFVSDIQCESILGVLNDSYIRAYAQKKTLSETLTYYLSKAVKYNGYTFKAGIIEDYTDTVSIEINYETVLSAVLNLADVVNRKIKTRVEGNTIYIDFVKSLSTETNTQTIKMGVNMLSITKELDVSDFATRVIPLATGDNSKKITIKSVNNNLDYIQDDEMVADYGVIEKVVEDTGTIKDAKTLLNWGKGQLSQHKSIKLVLDCSAVDLSYLSDVNITAKRINLDDKIQIVNNVLGVNVFVRVLEKKWSIFNAYNPQISLSSRQFTATDEILDIKNRQRIRNKISVLSTQYVDFEDNITKTKPIIKEFNLSGDFENAYVNISTTKYRYYTESGETYTTYPLGVGVYVNNTLVKTIADGEDIEDIVNIDSYLKQGINIIKITSQRNGRIKGQINIVSRN